MSHDLLRRRPRAGFLPVGGLLVALAAGTAVAQAPSAAAPAAPGAGPTPAARAADIEPGVDTSAAGAAAPLGRGAAAPSPVTPPANAAPAASAAGARPAAGTPSGRAAPADVAAGKRAGRAIDRVDLESSQITGNRELPRVLYIVPWRAPEAGDLEGRPVNSLLYELTKPVDRDVFRRENRYFDALASQSANADAAATQPATPGGPEK